MIKNKIIKRVIRISCIFATIFVLFFIFACIVTAKPLEEKDDPVENGMAYLENTINNDGNLKYTKFLNMFKVKIVNSYYKKITYEEYIDIDSEIVASMIEGKNAIKLGVGDSYKFKVTVEQEGLYALGFTYFANSSSIVDTEASMEINGVVEYYELLQLIFPQEWESSTEFKTDRYGNEILPSASRLSKWYENAFLADGSSLHDSPLYIYLDEGENTIDLTIKSGEVAISDIYLQSINKYLTYNEYLANYNGAPYYDGDTITIGAEEVYTKSSLDIRVYSLQDSTATRYDTSHKLLNAVYNASWDNGNQAISYKLNAPTAGLYSISIKFLQDSFLNMPVSRTIMINGEVPYEDLYAYPFYYSKKWQNETLHNDAGKLYVYLNEGENTLTFKVNIDIYRYAIEEIDRIMDEMNDLSLEIKSLTNGQTDTYRNWNISKYIPDLEDRLNSWCDQINNLRDYLKQFSSNGKESSTFSSLKVAITKLQNLAKDPDQIGNKITLFTDGSSSVSQVLGNLLLTLNNNPMGLERIYLSKADVKLPRAKENFFVSLFEGVKRFFISFFKKEYSTKDVSDDEVEVWVNRSRQYVEVMQQMVDEAGLKVKFSIMPDQNKLILANSSGDLPDVAIGISNWIPYDLALRGITVDLRGFNGYAELVANFAKGAMIPYAYEDGMYGIPETQDFWVTFYRSDIYSSLNLDVPSTWDDLIGQLPILQRLGYNFYSPLSSYRGLKPYVASLPILYQYASSGKYEGTYTGSLYTSDGMNTTLSDEAYVAALKFTTNLFTIYDVPEETLSFYNSFRYGTLPIGIANSSTYTSLLIAAPEINGNWSIAPHIGYEDINGNVNRYSTAGSQGITMFEASDKKQESWEFIKWWMSTPTQESFIQKMYSMYGLEYLWYSANLNAFATLPIEESHKQVMLTQLRDFSMEASRVPAAYMIERSISDAYSKVVFNGTNVRIALDDAVIESNREIERKMTEFKYIVNGVKVKDYIVPSIANIDQWLTSKEE
ncbi:MAG: extracellular solute-binding protein [Bacilli bacterium]|nr:extracellular solute-binding protein [Bacilli bacterium]